MNFQELKHEVQNIVKRPDLDSQVESAIKAATLKAHHSDYFFNDLDEVAVEFDEPRHIQNFAPREIIPKYRQAKYIRVWEGGASPESVATKFLDHIHVESALDSYGYTKVNVFYMAGSLLQIRTCTPLSHILFGYYLHPTITPEEEFRSWIAADYPWAIIYEAARAIFHSINFQEQSAQMRVLVQEQYGILSLSNVDTVPT